MTLWVCEACGTLYSVGASRCPYCGSTDSHEEGETRPAKPAPKKGGK